MKQELQNQLFENYPKIFRQKDLSPQETTMCWGISCGDGWFDIVNVLCQNIQKHAEFTGKSIEAVQVKSKWGALRVYLEGEGVDDFVRGLVKMAESVSRTIKENSPKEIFFEENEDDWSCTSTGERK